MKDFVKEVFDVQVVDFRIAIKKDLQAKRVYVKFKCNSNCVR